MGTEAAVTINGIMLHFPMLVVIFVFSNGNCLGQLTEYCRELSVRHHHAGEMSSCIC